MIALLHPSEPTRDRLRRACAALDLAELSGSPFAMSQALAEVGRCHREIQASASAEAHFRAAVRWARCVGSADHLADLLCEQADASARVALAQELQVMLAGDGLGTEAESGERPSAGRAARERARDAAFEVSQLVGRVSDPACEAQWLLRASEVLQRCGDHADAEQMQRRAFALMGGAARPDPFRHPAHHSGEPPGPGRRADG